MFTLKLGRGVISAAAATMISLGVMSAIADAKPGRSGNLGSRGDRTFSAPPPTATAPGAAAPIQKSITQPGQIAKSPAAAGATAAAAQAARPSMMRNLLLGGLIGAGLASIFGTGALASVLGFVLQTLLIAGLIYLAIAAFMAFRNRNNPAAATASGAGSRPAPRPEAMQRTGAGFGGGPLPPLTLTDADFQSFERLLVDIQATYGRNDIDTLGRLVTPEMLSYFAHELDENRRNGVRNEVGNAKLLQGDLSEAWRDSGSEYATVAMRYSLTDVTVKAATGEIVSGSRAPTEVTEIWTFRRNPNSGPQAWELSAIQQAA
jgi:predicted lipid-binding transport protein (Tim44 family)